MSISKIVVVSDLHCGSTVGLLPPKFMTLEGNEVGQNKIQKRLWDAWYDLWNDWVPWAVDGHEFAVVINGDLVEGLHHKTTEIVSPEFGDHVRAAQQALVPMTKLAPSKIFLTEGTECHTKNTEHDLGNAVGAVQDEETGKFCFPRLDLDVSGARCSFFHHVVATSRSYLEGSGLSITLGNERAEAARAGLPIPVVLGMAHRHRHGIFNDGQGIAFTTGAFQALTRHGRKVVPSAVPSPSCVVLDWSETGFDHIPQVYEKVYTPGKSQRVVVSI